jgi:hypothetical protein
MCSGPLAPPSEIERVKPRMHPVFQAMVKSVAEPFLSAWSWAVQHEDNFSPKGLYQFTSKLACLCPSGLEETEDTRLPCTPRAPVRYLWPEQSGQRGDRVEAPRNEVVWRPQRARRAIPISTEDSTP